MLTASKKKVILSFGCVLSILLGVFIYAIFREDTYISKTIISFIDLSESKLLLACFDNNFVKYYLPDYLWAFSFCCGILLILNPIGIKTTFGCSFIVFFFGTIYELLQTIKVIRGTGDIIDIALYFLATLTVSIFYLRGSKNEKNC